MARLTLLLLAATLACTSNGTTGPTTARGATNTGSEGVTYSAQTSVLESFPVQLRTVVTVTNTGSTPVTLTFPDGCIVLLRAYASPDARSPAWDQATSTGCTMALVDVRLAPGQSERFQTATDAREILGTRLPDGTYTLRAYLRPNGRLVEIPAGQVVLSVPR